MPSLHLALRHRQVFLLHCKPCLVHLLTAFCAVQILLLAIRCPSQISVLTFPAHHAQ